jgi:hypothetical protein
MKLRSSYQLEVSKFVDIIAILTSSSDVVAAAMLPRRWIDVAAVLQWRGDLPSNQKPPQPCFYSTFNFFEFLSNVQLAFAWLQMNIQNSVAPWVSFAASYSSVCTWPLPPSLQFCGGLASSLNAMPTKPQAQYWTRVSIFSKYCDLKAYQWFVASCPLAITGLCRTISHHSGLKPSFPMFPCRCQRQWPYPASSSTAASADSFRP